MGNNLNRKSPGFNCFSSNSKSTKRRQMKQSFSYDSATRHNFLTKMKNSLKSGAFSHGRVPKSHTDQNLLVIDEPHTDANLAQVDELYTCEKDDYIDEIERQFEKPPGRFQKSPAIYNIQSIENDDVKISDLISNSTSYSLEKDNCSHRTSRSASSLTMHSTWSPERPERRKFSPGLIKKLILKSLNNRPSSKLSDENCTAHAFGGIRDNQQGLKYIDDSVSCVLRQSSTSSVESLAASPSMSKSHTNLEASAHSPFFSFKILNDVNRKLNKIQHLKRRKSLKGSVGREPLPNDKQIYLNELNTIKVDCADNISVYTLFNTLNKQAPFASSENTTISTSIDLLHDQLYFQNSFSSLSLLNS